MTAIGPVTVGVGTWPFTAEAGAATVTIPTAAANNEIAVSLILREFNGRSLLSFDEPRGTRPRKRPSITRPSLLKNLTEGRKLRLRWAMGFRMGVSGRAGRLRPIPPARGFIRHLPDNHGPMLCPMTGNEHRLFWMRSAWWCQDCRQKVESCCEGGGCPSVADLRPSPAHPRSGEHGEPVALDRPGLD